MPFLGQPLTSTNPSFGAQSFAAIDLLETRDYVRDDVIFIKVHVDDPWLTPCYIICIMQYILIVAFTSSHESSWIVDSWRMHDMSKCK